MFSGALERARTPKQLWTLVRDALLMLKHAIIAEKSVARVVRKFHADLRNAAVVGFTSSGSILAVVRRLVRDAVRDAYIEGLVEGGIPADELSDDDASKIVELQGGQAEYITDFVRAIRAAKGDKAAQRAILDRVELWTISVEMAGEAGLNSAKANEMVVFTGDDGEESCETCQRLKNQKHRRRWFEDKGLVPRDPRFRDNFECGGWKCEHFLKPVK